MGMGEWVEELHHRGKGKRGEEKEDSLLQGLDSEKQTQGMETGGA